MNRHFHQMIEQYIDHRKKERTKLRKDLKEFEEESEMENSLIPGLTQSQKIGPNNNFARATMLYETVVKERKIPDHDKIDDLEQDDINLIEGNDSLIQKISILEKFTMAGKSHSVIWVFSIIIAEIMNIIGSIFLTINTVNTVRSAEVLLGFGSLIIWGSMIKYSENYKGYNIITNTMINSIWALVKAFIGVFPLIIGCTLMAHCFFNPHNRYAGGAYSLFSLSALMFGDSIFDIWYQSMIHVIFFSQIFYYIFVFISISVIINAFVMIVGDGYEDSKDYEKHDWIDKELPEPKTNHEKKIYLFMKILQKDFEICKEANIHHKIEKLEKKEGKKISKTEEELFEEEQAGKSMEYHTRKVISLLGEIKEAYEEEKDEGDNQFIDQQYHQL
mmetsp:Transcript_36761/g.36384  ORF Transcript_36761/g.36384 Transcript_36761/m.36384 type:complete len:389 (+) Transcript_36761:818-1984(+)